MYNKEVRGLDVTQQNEFLSWVKLWNQLFKAVRCLYLYVDPYRNRMVINSDLVKYVLNW